ncbi:MAG: hypothetical protein KC964_20410, partial [Candidatus Omnitrophica bacterium]|nr:hypothetical protein [Candidatus Omnitrophota bacterium]
TLIGVLAIPILQSVGAFQIPVAPPPQLEVAVQPTFSPPPVPPSSTFSEATRPQTPQPPAMALSPQQSSFDFFAFIKENAPTLAGSLWFLVVAILGTRYLRGQWGTLKKVKRSRPASKHLQEELDQTAEELGCKTPVVLKTSSEVTSPFLTGIRKPVLVIPQRMEEDKYAADLPGIFAHELAHVLSGDLFWMHLARWTSVLLWFHPLAWKVQGAHSVSCEEVCDSVAAQYTGDASTYSGTLARVALDISGAVPEMGGIPMIRGSEISRRLENLKRGKVWGALSSRWVAFSIAWGVISVGFVGATAFVQKDTGDSAQTVDRVKPNSSLPEGPLREIVVALNDEEPVVDLSKIEVELLGLVTPDGKVWTPQGKPLDLQSYSPNSGAIIPNVTEDLLQTLRKGDAKDPDTVFALLLQLTYAGDRSGLFSKVEQAGIDAWNTGGFNYNNASNSEGGNRRLVLLYYDARSSPKIPTTRDLKIDVLYDWLPEQLEIDAASGEKQYSFRGSNISLSVSIFEYETEIAGGDWSGDPTLSNRHYSIKVKGNDQPLNGYNYYAILADGTEHWLGSGEEESLDCTFGFEQGPIQKIVYRGHVRQPIVWRGISLQPVIDFVETRTNRSGSAEDGSSRESDFPNLETEDLVWGESVNGLRAALSLGNGPGPYRVGESVPIGFVVRNVSDTTVELMFTQPSVYPLNLEATDQNRSQVLVLSPKRRTGGRVFQEKLPPGGTLDLRTESFVFHPLGWRGEVNQAVILAKPGKYHLRQTITLPDRFHPFRDFWHGRITTADIGFEVIGKVDPKLELKGNAQADAATVMKLLGDFFRLGLDGIIASGDEGQADWMENRQQWERQCKNLGEGAVKYLGEVAATFPDANYRYAAHEALAANRANPNPSDQAKEESGRVEAESGPDRADRLDDERADTSVDSITEPLNLVWGEPVNGLRAAVEFVPEKEAYVPGDVIGIRFNIQNVSGESIAYAGLNPMEEWVKIKNSEGQWEGRECREYLLPAPTVPCVILPGNIAVYDNLPISIGRENPENKQTIGCVLPDNPGDYFVLYDVQGGNVRNKTNSDFDPGDAKIWWGRKLTTGVRKLTVKSEAPDSTNHPRLQLRLVAESKDAQGVEWFPSRKPDPIHGDRLPLLPDILFTEDDLLYANLDQRSASGDFLVALRFNDEAAERFSKVSEGNINRQMAMVFDGEVITSPVIRAPITGGRAIIEGGFSKEEAENMIEAIGSFESVRPSHTLSGKVLNASTGAPIA